MLLKMHAAPSYSSGKNVFWNVSGLLFLGSFWRLLGFVVEINFQGNSLAPCLGTLAAFLCCLRTGDKSSELMSRTRNTQVVPLPGFLCLYVSRLCVPLGWDHSVASPSCTQPWCCRVGSSSPANTISPEMVFDPSRK